MDAFSVRTKIMIGGGMDALAQRLHRHEPQKLHGGGN